MDTYNLNKIILPFSDFIFNKDEHVDPEILDRILQWHFFPINQIAHSTDVSHIACHRTIEHEKRKGRIKGKGGRSFWSEHTFEISQRQPEGKGATDIGGKDLYTIAELLIQNTSYTRFAIYANQRFIHCDYAFPDRGRRYFDGSWNELSDKKYFDIIKKI